LGNWGIEEFRDSGIEGLKPNPDKPELKIEYLWFAFGGSILFCRHRQSS